ncbi:hypothetical protein NIE111_002405 [Micromonospora sp. NIE111]|nr:hypothetical protein [Micromonospora hortensis]
MPHRGDRPALPRYCWACVISGAYWIAGSFCVGPVNHHAACLGGRDGALLPAARFAGRLEDHQDDNQPRRR